MHNKHGIRVQYIGKAWKNRFSYCWWIDWTNNYYSCSEWWQTSLGSVLELQCQEGANMVQTGLYLQPLDHGSTHHFSPKVKAKGTSRLLGILSPSEIPFHHIFSRPIQCYHIYTNPKTLSWTSSTAIKQSLYFSPIYPFQLAFHQFPPLDANSSQPQIFIGLI